MVDGVNKQLGTIDNEYDSSPTLEIESVCLISTVYIVEFRDMETIDISN